MIKNIKNYLTNVIESSKSENKGKSKTKERDLLSNKIFSIEKKLMEIDEDFGGFSDQLIARSTRPLNVAIVGEYSSGKSTFINALLGSEILPSGPLPTTGVPTYIMRGEQTSLTLQYRSGEREQFDVQRLHQLSTRAESREGDALIPIEKIDRIELYHNSRFLRDLTIIDTPGLNAPNKEDSLLTQKILEDSDAIIWLTPANQVISQTEQKVLKEFSDRYKQKSLCAISKIDTVPMRDRSALLNYVKSQMGSYFRSIDFISAREALDGSPQGIEKFLNSLNQEMLPLARSWVEERIYDDLVAHVDDALEGEQELLNHANDFRKGLDWLSKSLTKSINLFNKSIEGSFSLYKTKIKSIYGNLVYEIRKSFDTYEATEPYQAVVEGFFVDDYVIRYKTVKYIKISDSFLEKADEKLQVQLDDIGEELVNSLNSAFEEFYDQLGESSSQFQESQPIGSKIIINPSDLVNYMEFYTKGIKEINDAFNMYKNYIQGGINCGGFYSINFHISALEIESIPSNDDIKLCANTYLPVNNIILDLEDRPGIVKNQIKHLLDSYINILVEKSDQIIGPFSENVEALRLIRSDL